MCFSAEASFISAGVLGLFGCETIRQAKTNRQIPLALLPWLFGFHQLNEGILWIFLGEGAALSALAYTAQSFYIFMAYLFFPVWIPVSVILLETDHRRKRLMGLLLICGLALAFLNTDKFLMHHDMLRIYDHSIQYPPTDWHRGIPYLFALCGPFLLSSQPRLWCLGVLGTITFLIAYYFYFWTLASVWCFFAALISILIYWVLKGLNRS